MEYKKQTILRVVTMEILIFPYFYQKIVPCSFSLGLSVNLIYFLNKNFWSAFKNKKG